MSLQITCPSTRAIAVITALAFWSTPSPGLELRAAFSAECPTTKFPEPEEIIPIEEGLEVAAAIAVTFANTLIDTGIAALKKAVNPVAATLEGRFLEQGLYVYVTNSKKTVNSVVLAPNMGCLVVAAGNFTSSPNGVKGWKLPFETNRPIPDIESEYSPNFRVKNALNLEGPATLAYYLEAARVFSVDKTAVTWRPVRLFVSEYLNESFWAGQSRSTAVEMRLYKPGKTEPFYSQEFAFSSLSKPVNKGPALFADKSSGTWNELPAAPAVPPKLTPLPEGRPFDPYTLEVRIVEAPKPYALAVAFADAVDSNKDAIKKDITDQLDPKAKAATVLTGQGATLATIKDYLDAYKAVVSDCAVDMVKDEAGKLNCSIARDKAIGAKQSAENSCKSNSVNSCSGLPKVPDVPA